MKAENRNHDRAPGMTSMSFSLPEQMKQKLQTVARSRHRSVSNFLQLLVAREIDSKEFAVREDEEKYGID